VKTHDVTEARMPTPAEIVAALDRRVIGQSRAKRVAALAAYNHLKRLSQTAVAGRPTLKKSNVLMIGPTGVGKTYLARVLAETLDLPFVVVDATEYTEAGYYGKDVEVMIAELLFATNLNVEAAERGIVFVDEIDKVARRSGGFRTGAGARDIGGEGVQQAMLKLLEGRKLFVPYNLTQHWNKHDFVEVDTTNILFICAGTFTDISGWTEPGAVGFSSENAAQRRRRRRIAHKQLLEYGMLSEFLGRLPVVVQLDTLDSDDLYKILTQPADSLLGEYRELLAVDGVTLEASEAALRVVADFAHRRRIGARGLRSIMEEVLHDLLFDAPKRRGETVKLTPKLVRAKLETFDSGMLEE